MDGYVDFEYDEKLRPYTRYPFQLSTYLFNRFHMEKRQKLLDVGCGRGEFAKGFKELGLEVYGLDDDKTSSSIPKDIEIKYCDIENEVFPYEAESFDVIFCKSVIEHLSDPENLIKESHRVLKPSGRMIIMTPDWVSQMKVFFDAYLHKQPYTIESVRKILSFFGFQDVISERFYQLPVLWRYPGLKMVSFILRSVIPIQFTTKSKNKFLRWSTELMILGTGVKE